MELYGHSSEKDLLFDSLGLDGFKFFVANNDEAITDEKKVLKSIFKKCKVSLVNQKLTLCTMNFSTDSWEKPPHTKKNNWQMLLKIYFIC